MKRGGFMQNWSWPTTLGFGFLDSSSSASSVGSETRFWLVCPWGEHCGWSRGDAPVSSTCWRGTLSPALESDVWCRGNASYGHSSPSASSLYCHFWNLLLKMWDSISPKCTSAAPISQHFTMGCSDQMRQMNIILNAKLIIGCYQQRVISIQ